MGKILVLYYSREDLLPDWQKQEGKIGCAFSSEGEWGSDAELTCQSLLIILKNFGFLVLGVPDCTGTRFTTHNGATQAGDSGEFKEEEFCRKLGKHLAELETVFVDGRREFHPLNGYYKRNP